MRIARSSANSSIWVLAGLGLAGMAFLIGLFVLPYAVPNASTVISASSLLGYNNAVAYVLYIGLMVPAGVLLARMIGTFPPISTRPARPDLRFMPTPMVWAVLFGHLFLFAFLYAVKGAFVFGDGLYFQHILTRMVGGAVPYRDVNFLYGPAMLYPAFWLTRLVSVQAAFGLYYVAVYLASLYLLSLCVQMVSDDRHDSDRMFLVFSVGLFNLLLGLNYVFVRHLLPVATVCVAWRHLGQPRLRFLLGAGVLLFLTLAYSLEMGVLAVGGVMLLIVMRAGRPWWTRLVARVSGTRADQEPFNMEAGARAGRDGDSGLAVLPHAMLVCVPAVAAWLGIFYAIDPTFHALAESMRPVLSYSAGGGNTPIYPSLPILYLIAVSVVALAFTMRAVAHRRFQASAELAGTLLVMAFLMQRAAFGKPDVPHIAYSGLPILLVTLWVLPSRLGRLEPKKWFAILTVVSVLVPLQVFNGFMFKPFFERHLQAWATPQAAAAASKAGTTATVQASLRRAIDHFGHEQIYYLHIMSYYSLPVATELKLKQVPYFVTLEEAFTEQEMASIMSELRESEAVVISLGKDLQPSSPPSYDGWEGWLYQWTASSLPGSRSFFEVVKANDRLREPLLEFFRSSYDVVFVDGEVVGLVPRHSVRGSADTSSSHPSRTL